MDPRFEKIVKADAQRSEEATGWRVAEYKKLMADLTEKGKAEIEAIERVKSDSMKVITAAVKKYPLSENISDPVLKKHLGDYHGLLRTGRRICQEHPALIRGWLDKIENVTPETFRFYSAKTLADADRAHLSPLLAGSAFLKKLPMELSYLETFIIQAMSHCESVAKNSAQRTLQPASVTQPPPRENEISEFDPRLT